jgi:capsular polysaccharide biosynthesis protein
MVVAALATGILAALVAGVTTLGTTPTYRSQALLAIDQPGAIAASPDDGIIAKLSRLRAKYAGLVRTQEFAEPVATELSLPVGALVTATSATADPASLLVVIRAQTHDREDAVTIAAAMSEHLVDYAATEQAATNIPANQRVSFRVVTPALPADKVSPTRERAILVASGAFLLAAGLVFAVFYVGRRNS